MSEQNFAFKTDLYQLTMAAAYFENGLHERAIFELFTRRFPPRRSYLIAAGLEQALDYLSTLSFTGEQIDYLREHPAFKNVSREFFDYLEEFRFTGDVWAMPEGTAFFPNEPALRVIAPIIEAQVVETFLLSIVNFQTLIASKAARIVTAAQGRSVIEFGTRRAHGADAGLIAARAAYVGGCAGTSNVEAGYVFGIPIFGTLAHAFIMLFDEEDDAFRAFLKVFPDTATLLVDTYDTIAAVERIARDFPKVAAIRLDSGDLLGLSIRSRQILDAAGKADTKIFVSNDLSEYRIAELLSQGARIDAFGVGTELATSFDAPALGGVYKLVGLMKDGRVSMRMKMSPEKVTLPGPKQVWRRTGDDGKYAGDIVALLDEDAPAGSWQPLLEPVMERGNPLEKVEGAREAKLAYLDRARARAAAELRRLPPELLALDRQAPYEVKISDHLQQVKEQLQQELRAERG
ncbi:MAG TPA: nicotinate phosphoribosyltransferase [Blastocatellia bacterium]|nr:nicotinate phosphoribosyltransferase [Blastocatellia bacterium]